jgi:hypothetical protein
VALVTTDARRDPVDEALAPARALDDERPLPVADDRLDRLALPLAELGGGPSMVWRWSWSGGEDVCMPGKLGMLPSVGSLVRPQAPDWPS